MEADKSEVSIIVPIYNSEKYLRRCVDSILSQTFSDFELLLVDDGSTDGSGSICDEYSAKDSRVRVFHKENGGVSSARNLGLDNARGEWITFVDSDDYLEKSFLAELSVFEDVDFVISGGRFINKGRNYAPQSTSKMKVDDDLPFMDEQLMQIYLRTPWGKLYKSSIVQERNLRFAKMIVGEDIEFNLRYLQSVQILAFLSKSSYMYNDDFNQGRRYRMNSECYKRHLSILFSSLNGMSLKFNYDFPKMRERMQLYYKELLFFYLVDIKTYSTFKKEAYSFRKCKCVYYDNSRLMGFIKTNMIKYFPFAAYAYFRRYSLFDN